MARELSQEALLDFLCQAGGRVTNAALLSHFKGFLRDPAASPSQHQRRRELFKGFVNSVAAVRQDPDGTRYVVLKRRFRDLLGEEGLQRPRDPPAAAAPAGGAAPASQRGAQGGEPPRQTRRRRRGKEPEEEPAGAAAAVPSAGCNGLPASGARQAAGGGGERRGSSDSRARVSTAEPAAAQAGARCAAQTTLGRPCWECLQNGLDARRVEPPPGAAPAPVTAGKKPARAPQAQDDRGTPSRPPKHAPAEPAQVPSEPGSPPTTVEAAESGASAAPTLPSSYPSSRQLLDVVTPGSQSYSTLDQQQQRTREWVARHPQVYEARDQGPVRAWSVLPSNFSQVPPEQDFCNPQPNPAPLDSALSSPSLFPLAPESRPRNPPMTVFRSIRCQLSLQDLDDFVDQESHGSEESSSGPKESPGGSEEGLQVALGTPEWRKLRSPLGGIAPKEDSPGKSLQGHRGAAHTSQHVVAEASGLADHPQEPLPSPALKIRRSLRRSLQAGRAKLSSSEEDDLQEDSQKRNRRRPRSRKPSKAAAVSSPRVDAALMLKPADIKAAVAGGDLSHSSWPRGGEESSALTPHRFSEHKSSLVPLDAREHEWIVKLASGSWIQVLALFWQDPQLALHKDFLTGYTALHWMAKHGNLVALRDLVSAAQKAGIALDVNVKSSCGYTPLHLAAIHGHQGVIKLLVERLASRVNVRDHSGKKPWQYLSSNTSGEIWQLLKAPRDKPIFPVYPLVRSSSPTRKAKSRDTPRSVSRKTSLAALLKNQHNKWKLANQYDKFPTPWEREEYSD